MRFLGRTKIRSHTYAVFTRFIIRNCKSVWLTNWFKGRYKFRIYVVLVVAVWQTKRNIEIQNWYEPREQFVCQSEFSFLVVVFNIKLLIQQRFFFALIKLMSTESIGTLCQAPISFKRTDVAMVVVHSPVHSSHVHP